MRIGVDVRKINDGGIGRYIKNLVYGMVKAEKKHEYVFFFAPQDIDRYQFPDGQVTKVIETAKKYSIAEHWSLAANAKKHGVDLFHAPHYTLPLALSSPSVVTIHDLIHLFDRSVGLIAKNYARFMIWAAVRKADRVIAVSETARKSIVEMYPACEKKTRAIHNGSGDFYPATDKEQEQILKKFGVEPKYLLFVGSDRPHKNIKAVYEVLKRTDAGMKVVIVGRVRDRSVFAPFGDRIVFLENLPIDQMRAIYTGARTLLFPSYMEGFGLPPLEAMACHTPVVASNRSSIPEITGDAAILCEPDDYDGMTEAIKTAMEDGSLRSEIIEKGLERAKKFSWKKTVEETLAVYEEVAS